MTSDRSSVQLIATILERCSKSADGYPFKCKSKCKSDLMQDLAEHGLVVIGTDGWVITTGKGKLALCSLTVAPDGTSEKVVH